MMQRSIFHLALIFISRSIAKIFLFVALSVSTPAVNAMRSLQEREAIVILLDNSSFHRRDRSLVRRLGYQPELRFVMYQTSIYGI
ncbi:MAG: hypothetical protein ACHQM6_10355 [Candidatus Kapaibacterium sp.]